MSPCLLTFPGDPSIAIACPLRCSKARIIGHKVRICIVASKYNEKFTDSLVENCIEELGDIIPMSRIDLIRVPGAFEIPVAVAAVIDREEINCIIALGLIIRAIPDIAISSPPPSPNRSSLSL